MITNLNSWSFEPSSNKSVGNLSDSFICGRSSNDLFAAGRSVLPFPQAFGPSSGPSSRFAQRSSLLGQQTRGRLGKPIPIPSHDHSAQSTADHPSAPVAFPFAPSVRSVHPRFHGPISSDSCPLVFIRGSFSRHQPVNLTNLMVLTLHNPLISRVCTPLHVNQFFFFTPSGTAFPGKNTCLLTCPVDSASNPTQDELRFTIATSLCREVACRRPHCTSKRKILVGRGSIPSPSTFFRCKYLISRFSPPNLAARKDRARKSRDKNWPFVRKRFSLNWDFCTFAHSFCGLAPLENWATEQLNHEKRREKQFSETS